MPCPASWWEKRRSSRRMRGVGEEKILPQDAGVGEEKILPQDAGVGEEKILPQDAGSGRR
jgi:hypothetical protein